jgi:hypothetical protein
MKAIWPKVSLADLIRALGTLEPDNDGIKNVASMLGFELDNEVIPIKPSKPEKSQRSFSDRSLPYNRSIKSQKPRATSDVLANLAMKTIKENVPIDVPIPKMPEPLKDNPVENEPLPEHNPLLVPIWTRAIITKLLSVEADEGSPDILKLIKIISENQPLRQIPRKSYPTLRRGVQILIDIGPGLVPYIRDQISLLERLEHIVGTDLVEVWDFIGTPLKYSVSHDESLGSKYELPSSGTPILMLTDLGITIPPFATEVTSVDDWIEFAHCVHEAECPLLALTPYDSTRWPNALKDQIEIIKWDRETTVLTVSKLLS